jgi:hypothetical protein
MKILVITSCTGEKQHTPDGQLTKKDFLALHDRENFQTLEERLTEHRLPAEEMYTGLQHVRLMRGVQDFRTKAGKDSIDLRIVSAGYGVIKGSRKIVPYECTFQGMKKGELKEWADHLRIPHDIRKVFAQSYDLGLVLLGDSYLAACQLDDQIHLGGPTLFFCGAAVNKKFPAIQHARTLILTNNETKRFSCGLVGLKGEVASRLLTKISDNQAFSIIPPNADLLALLDGAQRTSQESAPKSRPNSKVDQVITIPESWWKKPHRAKLRYFIPEWDDLVDPDYDFINDEHSGGTGDWSNEVYAHQLYPEPNYDGILMSRAVAEKSKKKKERINALGVHRFLRVPREFPIMGDCGAFDYIMKETPPYTTEDVIDYYTRLGFDYGVSVDHLIVTATEHQKKSRYELTIHNAEEFLKAHRKAGLEWEPIGAVQGWDPDSYAKAAAQYVKMGYKYLGLGGLVRTKSRDIIDVVKRVRASIPSDVSIHLFGVARLDAAVDFFTAGIQSVDSASYLRQAWMRLHQSYASSEGPYAALRIPEAGKSFRAKHMLSNPEMTDDKIVNMEQRALKAVRAYAVGQCSLGNCLDALLTYDQFVTKERISMEKAYRRTLEHKPWAQCQCAICRKWGIEVAIFRGNNRNRRRGFHNTYVFYRLFQDVLSGKTVPFLNKDQWNLLLFDKGSTACAMT